MGRAIIHNTSGSTYIQISLKKKKERRSANRKGGEEGKRKDSKRYENE